MRYGGEVVDWLTVALLAAGLRERVIATDRGDGGVAE